MTITEAVCQRLLTADAVQAWVGPRVYQLKLPQQPTLPAIRVQLVAEPAAYHLRGVIDVWDALVQVDDPAELRLARLVQEYRLWYHHVPLPGKTRRPEASKKEIASWRM